MKSGGKPRNLKQNNTRAVIDRLRVGGDHSVAGISDNIKLSKTTVKKIFDSLGASGLLLSAGKGDSTDEGGKKPELYKFNKNFGYAISLHVTPEDLIAVITDLCAEITFHKAMKLDKDRSLSGVMSLLVETIRGFVAMKAAAGERLIGIAVVLPGLVDPLEGISIYTPHYPDWGRDVPFNRILKEGLGEGYDVPIHTENANRIQALAESTKGVARGCKNFVIIDALNEGLGAGIVLHGEVVLGAQSISGEVGHITLDSRDGFPCICGHRGCFEAMVSARRLLALAREGLPGDSGSTLAVLDPALRLDDICQAAARGDPLAIRLVEDAARWFIVGLGNLILINDPELIVIQGVYVKAGELFLDRLREGIRRIGLPNVEKRVRIEYSAMGEERGVIGGAAFVVADFFEKRIVF
jgi:predicted NBD/HSP70 family sugar kinase